MAGRFSVGEDELTTLKCFCIFHPTIDTESLIPLVSRLCSKSQSGSWCLESSSFRGKLRSVQLFKKLCHIYSVPDSLAETEAAQEVELTGLLFPFTLLFLGFCAINIKPCISGSRHLQINLINKSIRRQSP